MGTVPSDILLESLSVEERKEVERESQKQLAEYKALQSLRKQLGFTQNDLAAALDLAQNNISELESRADMRLSTLRNYVEAMGCEMSIVVTKPDETEVRLQDLIHEDAAQ